MHSVDRQTENKSLYSKFTLVLHLKQWTVIWKVISIYSKFCAVWSNVDQSNQCFFSTLTTVSVELDQTLVFSVEKENGSKLCIIVQQHCLEKKSKFQKRKELGKNVITMQVC